MIVIRGPKIFCINFDCTNYVDESLKHEIELIIKSNESVAEKKIKSEIEQLLLKYNHGNNMFEYGNE